MDQIGWNLVCAHDFAIWKFHIIDIFLYLELFINKHVSVNFTKIGIFQNLWVFSNFEALPGHLAMPNLLTCKILLFFSDFSRKNWNFLNFGGSRPIKTTKFGQNWAFGPIQKFQNFISRAIFNQFWWFKRLNELKFDAEFKFSNNFY